MYTVEKENSSSLDNNGEEIIDDMYENIEKLSEDEAMVIGKNLYDRATEIYKVWILRPYCGYSLEEINNQRVELLGNSGMGNGQYYKSDFSSLDYLK